MTKDKADKPEYTIAAISKEQDDAIAAHPPPPVADCLHRGGREDPVVTLLEHQIVVAESVGLVEACGGLGSRSVLVLGHVNSGCNEETTEDCAAYGLSNHGASDGATILTLCPSKSTVERQSISSTW